MTDTIPKTDELGEAIILEGLAVNSFLLDLNGSLEAPRDFRAAAPFNLPSRLFQWPIETNVLKDGTRRLGLRHPELAAHPFVHHVEKVLGVKLDPHGAPNDYGVTDSGTAQWWHAVDLISAGMWRELLDTAQFTTPKYIMDAVAYGLDYSRHDDDAARGFISTHDARVIMCEMGSEEPDEDRAAFMRRVLMKPSACKQDKKATFWAVNTNSGICAEEKAWSRIIGLEYGWLAHDRAGFLQWSEAGRDRMAASATAAAYVEQKTGQVAFNF